VRQRLLIDSELALWALAAPARLSRELRARLDAADVYLSAASILEIGLKSAPGPRAAELLAALEPSGFRTLPVSAEHAALAAGLAGEWPDPLDRLLVAQASAEGLTLLTTDPALAAPPAAPGRVDARSRAQRAGEATPPRRRVRGAHAVRHPRPERLPERLPERCPVVLATEAPRRRRAGGRVGARRR
jgi:PIN domain nuclease of toxin-antitoxin system